MKFVIDRVTKHYSDDGRPLPPIAGLTLEHDQEWDYPERIWSREINTLEELMQFMGEHGTLVLHEPDPTYLDLPRIEIYDGFRE